MSELAVLTDLYDATRAIGLADSLDQVIDDILDRAQELIGFEHCALMLRDEADGQLTVERIRGYGDRADAVLGMTIEQGEGLSGWAAERRQAVRVGDVKGDPRYLQGLREARSNLAVPLVVGNEVPGVINVESERPDAFTERHEKLLTVLGAQAALAILAGRARHRLQERLSQLDALYRISRLASRMRDLDETLRRILAITRRIAPEGQVAILLLEPEGHLRVRAAEGYKEGVEELTIPLGEGITGHCAATQETVVVDEVDRHPDYIRGVLDGRSEIAVPLKVEGEIIGVLDVEATRPGAFGQEEERTLSVIAQQVAAVVHTVRLHQETRELATTDSLTGLHNRRHFIETLEDHVQRALRYDEQLALLLLDCDELKQINDRFGHHWGDRALREIAGLLESTLRESDVTARLGGDEFALLLLDADAELAFRVTERLRSEIARVRLTTDGGEEIELSTSIGVTVFPADGRDARELLRKADDALYEAKRRGRNQVVVFGETAGSDATPAEGSS